MKLLLVAIVLCLCALSQGHVLRKDRRSPDIVFVEAGEECLTPDFASGQCIVIDECTELLQMMTGKFDRDTIDFLRSSTCGFDGRNPKVCCPIDGARTEAPPPLTMPALPETTADSTSAPIPESATAQPVIVSGGSADKPFTLPPYQAVTDEQYPVLSVCGRSKALGSRILGGSEAEEGAWPWMALLLYKNASTGAIYRGCSGVLVGDRQVLTSAYCIEKAELVKVRLGLHQWGVQGPFRDVLVRKIIPHEFYKKKTGQNDIALIVLDATVEFNDRIQPICLPRDKSFQTDDFVGESPWIAGWGSTTEGGPSSELLRQVQIPIFSPLSCRESYKGSVNYMIDDSVICAGSPEGGKDFCTIDAGGPLMLSLGVEGNYYLLGIISSGRGCGRAGFPGIYTRVAQFIDWLVPKLLQSSTETTTPWSAEDSPTKRIIARAVGCGASDDFTSHASHPAQ